MNEPTIEDAAAEWALYRREKTMPHDPQLCAAVARVMGCEQSPAMIAEYGEFSPDTDPADAWQVLEWLVKKRGVFAAFELISDEAHEDDCDGDMKVWLCRAVAAREVK